MDSFQLARVVGVNPQSHTADVVLLADGRRFDDALIATAYASTNSGVVDLPDPTVRDAKDLPHLTYQRDMLACVIVHAHLAYIIGFVYPQRPQMLFAEHNRKIDRHASDVYSTTDSAGNLELYHPSGTYFRIGEDPDHEDLTGKDANALWAITENTDKRVHIKLATANGGAIQSTFHADPVGNVELSGAGTFAADYQKTIHLGSQRDLELTAANDLKLAGANASVQANAIALTAPTTAVSQAMNVGTNLTVGGQIIVGGQPLSMVDAAQSAEDAATSATDASNAATDAADSASAADQSATAAATYQTTAANSASAAGQAATDAGNAASAAGISATAAGASASTASTSASHASDLASAAGDSADLSQLWAVSATAVVAGQFSAKYYADQSGASASDAADSKNATATSETNAKTSETNAATSASAAATSETNAKTSATNAANSASAAATSESNAASSESSAANSANAASTSASNAATSESNAASSENLAHLWADSATVVANGEYSAKYWAGKAHAVATGAMIYIGAWDASTATFPAPTGRGDLYKVSVAGSVSDAAGSCDYAVGDQIIYNGGDASLCSGWDKIDNTELVTSVAGRVGAIELFSADILDLQSKLDAKADLAGATFTGAVSVPATFQVRAENSTNEGGQLKMAGAGSNPTVILDSYHNTFRVFGGAAAPFELNLDNGDVSARGNLTARFFNGFAPPSESATANAVVARNSSGDLQCRLLRQSYAAAADGGSNYFLCQHATGEGADNYARPYTAAAVANRLGQETWAFAHPVEFGGGSEFNANGVHLRGKGNQYVIIDADTDNVNESEHPILEFKQDGGLTVAVIQQGDDNQLHIYPGFTGSGTRVVVHGDVTATGNVTAFGRGGS